jgi:hypothetical protein
MTAVTSDSLRVYVKEEHMYLSPSIVVLRLRVAPGMAMSETCSGYVWF